MFFPILLCILRVFCPGPLLSFSSHYVVDCTTSLVLLARCLSPCPFLPLWILTRNSSSSIPFHLVHDPLLFCSPYLIISPFFSQKFRLSLYRFFHIPLLCSIPFLLYIPLSFSAHPVSLVCLSRSLSLCSPIPYPLHSTYHIKFFRSSSNIHSLPFPYLVSLFFSHFLSYISHDRPPFSLTLFYSLSTRIFASFILCFPSTATPTRSSPSPPPDLLLHTHTQPYQHPFPFHTFFIRHLSITTTSTHTSIYSLSLSHCSHTPVFLNLLFSITHTSHTVYPPPHSVKISFSRTVSLLHHSHPFPPSHQLTCPSPSLFSLSSTLLFFLPPQLHSDIPSPPHLHLSIHFHLTRTQKSLLLPVLFPASQFSFSLTPSPATHVNMHSPPLLSLLHIFLHPSTTTKS